jgi:hypothetical protein
MTAFRTRLVGVAVASIVLCLQGCGGGESDQPDSAATKTSEPVAVETTEPTPSPVATTEEAASPVSGSFTTSLKSSQGYTADVTATWHEVRDVAPGELSTCARAVDESTAVKAIQVDIETVDTSAPDFQGEFGFKVVFENSDNIGSTSIDGLVGNPDVCPPHPSGNGDSAELTAGDSRVVDVVWSATKTPNAPDGFEPGEEYWKKLVVTVGPEGNNTCSATKVSGQVVQGDEGCRFALK